MINRHYCYFFIGLGQEQDVVFFLLGFDFLIFGLFIAGVGVGDGEIGVGLVTIIANLRFYIIFTLFIIFIINELLSLLLSIGYHNEEYYLVSSQIKRVLRDRFHCCRD